MGISNCFLSTGTQLKVEKPTKGCVVTSCDTIDGPIVKLKNGSVKKIESFEEAKTLYKDVEEIIYFGDILFSLGDVTNRNYELLKPGYVEEWWKLELKKALEDKKLEIDLGKITFEQAKELSEKFKIPLHPKFIFFWSQISQEEFLGLLEWMKTMVFSEGKGILDYHRDCREKYNVGKRALEIIGAEHEVTTENVVINKENTEAFLINLGLGNTEKFKENLENYMSDLNKCINIALAENKKLEILDFINERTKVKIKDKAGTFIGARMGRPEKAKPRELKGSPHVLFPVGEEGGKLRSFQAAMEKGSVKADFPIYFCENCNKESVYHICEDCGKETKQMFYCASCDKKTFSESCNVHGRIRPYMNKRVNVTEYYKSAMKKLDIPNTIKIVKGVKGTSSSKHFTENLAKGILRAYYNIHVNKDGTIRYDVTELPITHFKPKEIMADVKRLKDLGYDKDIYGNELENENQILELKPQDIILPACPDSGDQKADDTFFNVSKFIDTMLDKLYKIGPFYNLKKKEDLIGQLTVTMAPHNCAGVITRIIGFSKVQGILASPYVHAAVRRDCDGDEVAVMLLLDVLINFSREFLPAHRGGTQDAPLVLNARVRAREVDDQILDLELGNYPLELYELAEKREHSSKVVFDNVKKRLKEGKDPLTNIGFTHDCSDFNHGVTNSSYKAIPTMDEKVQKQMDLVCKLRAVDSGDVARLLIERHFIRDIKGNFNKFTQQSFRCVDCNEIYRRPPLAGKCIALLNDGTTCNGRIIFTIAEGSIMKYLNVATNLTRNYNVPPYVTQSLEITKSAIETIFGKDNEKQKDLKAWF
jgi:DNA polymerase II large subunit